MTENFTNFIAGAWVAPRTGAYLENRNPADAGDVIGCFPRSGPEDVARAIESAQRGFARWSQTPAPVRGEVLHRVGDLLTRRKEELARAITREMGKVLVETRGDVQEGIDTAHYAHTEGRRLFGRTVPSELRHKWAMSFRRPIGLAGLITPFNFPLAIPTWKMFPALLCGNAMLVMDDADLDLALDGVLWGAFGTTGQRCTATSRLIVHEKVHDRLLKMICDRAERLRLGPGLDEKTEVGPLINEEAGKKVEYYVGVGRDEGAAVVIGGERGTGQGPGRRRVYQAAGLRGVRAGMRVEQEEIFGPVLSVIKVGSLDEAIRINNGVKYGLSSSLYTRDVNARSEEHTCELQSPCNLVCRLLLEKKKKKIKNERRQTQDIVI